MSPSGVDAFRRKQQSKETQKQEIEQNRANNIFTNDFSLKGGQFAVIRILEQGDDLTFTDFHRIPVAKKNGGTYFKDFVCLDQHDDGTPCPACQNPNKDYAKRSTRGVVNIIWREGPVWQRDENKRMVKGADNKPIVIGREDQLALWKCSWTVFEMLKAKDLKWQGLMSRDWEVTRTGNSMNDTVWNIEPAEPTAPAAPMTIADLALASDKYDLSKITTAQSYDSLAQILNRGAVPGGAQPTMDRSALVQGQPPTADSTFGQGQGQPATRSSAFTRG